MDNNLRPLIAFQRIKNAPTIYVGCASDIYTRYPYECKTIEQALMDYETLKIEYQYKDLALHIIKDIKGLVPLILSIVMHNNIDDYKLLKGVLSNDK